MTLPAAPHATFVEDLTPREIVAALDRHVVGQKDAKRAVAIAMRNRWRRQQVDPETAEDIAPKNILMMGPTGVGKTEIARRLAKLARAPFLKIEASKFTEVGYVGRDVESIVRDLMELAVVMVSEEKRAAVEADAASRADERLLQILVPQAPQPAGESGDPADQAAPTETRERFRQWLEEGRLDHRMVEIEVDESSPQQFEMITPQGVEAVGFNLKEMLPGLFGKRKRQMVEVSEAREILRRQEAEALIDRQDVAEEARLRVEQAGIVFLDEIDKVAGRNGGHGPDVSREGVQRDLLPIVEGTTVTTKYGPVKTDHVLFIGAGAFHVAKPSDLIPELQGRFPIRVELGALGEEEFVRILTEPDSALVTQYRALLGAEGLDLTFGDDAVREVARLAVQVNSQTENIGARRLATLMERLLEEVSFEAPDMDGVALKVDAAYVDRALADVVKDRDLSRYVL